MTTQPRPDTALNTYEQMKSRLEGLFEEKESLTKEFHGATSAGVRQLVHEDIVSISDAIDRLIAKIEKYEDQMAAHQAPGSEKPQQTGGE